MIVRISGDPMGLKARAEVDYMWETYEHAPPCFPGPQRTSCLIINAGKKTVN
jgi:hypothetical protein